MTGFQTCALPIFGAGCFRESASAAGLARPPGPGQDPDAQEIHAHNAAWFHASLFGRSLTPPHAVAPPAIVLRIPSEELNPSPRRLRLWPKSIAKARGPGMMTGASRSEERRVGKGCVSRVRFGWSQYI